MDKSNKAFVCGWPVDHSRSPVIHNYWLQHHGLEGAYVKQAVSVGDLPGFLGNLSKNGFVGGNITLPHKEQTCGIVDRLDPVAKKLGAVNTVWLENGTLHGANTDGYGFLANLDQRAMGWDKGKDRRIATVLGAGGASRAIIFALQSRGFTDIRLVNRTLSKAEELARLFMPGVTALGFDSLPGAMRDTRLLVNTTSMGMTGKSHLEIDLQPLPDSCLVTDIVYTPLQTVLLRDAQKRGLVTVDGLGMLLHQAVPGFEKWFGVRPKVTDQLRQMVIEDLDITT